MSGTGLTVTRWNPPADPRDPDDVRIPSPVVERVLADLRASGAV